MRVYASLETLMDTAMSPVNGRTIQSWHDGSLRRGSDVANSMKVESRASIL